jgi:hypothetical protein
MALVAEKEKKVIEMKKKDDTTYLDGYHSIRLSLTGNMEEDICKLYEFYSERMCDKTPANIVKETLYEYVTIFNARGLIGAEVVADRISMVSRKSSDDKKNVSYLVGCLRGVLEHGLASTSSIHEKRLISNFEKKYGVKLTVSGVQRLLSLATKKSSEDVLFTLIENDIDIEGMLMDKFESLMGGAYEEKSR